MNRVLVLDAEALSVLGGPSSSRKSEVRAALEAARRLDRDVVVPAVVLAELYRGPQMNGAVDSCLARDSAIEVVETDRSMAKLVGGILGSVGADSSDMVDAHCVASAVAAGGGVVLTSDLGDLERLAAGYSNVVAVSV